MYSQFMMHGQKNIKLLYATSVLAGRCKTERKNERKKEI